MSRKISESQKATKRGKEIVKNENKAIKAQQERLKDQAKREAEINAEKAKVLAAKEAKARDFTATKKKEIQAWLDSDRDFSQGFALLCQVCNNRSMMARISRKTMLFRVEHELQKRLDLAIINPSRIKYEYFKAVRQELKEDPTPSANEDQEDNEDSNTIPPTPPVNSDQEKTEEANIIPPSAPETESQEDLAEAIQRAESAAERAEDAVWTAEELVDSAKETAIRFKKASEGKINPNNLPDEVEPYFDRACVYHRTMQHLHTKADLLKTDAERKDVMDELMSVEKDHQMCWVVIDAWLKDGRLPEAPAPVEEPTNKVDADLTLSKCKSFLTKALIGVKDGIPVIDKRTGEAYEAYKLECKQRVDFLLKNAGKLGKYEEVARKHGLIE